MTPAAIINTFLNSTQIIMFFYLLRMIARSTGVLKQISDVIVEVREKVSNNGDDSWTKPGQHGE